jgi:OOP family OmpA-OmpF porin
MKVILKNLLLILIIFSTFKSIAQDQRKLVNLGPNINSTEIDISPVISADGKSLYFVREGHEQNQNFQDIWLSELGADGKWQPARRLEKPLNTSESNSVVSVSTDGNKLFVKGQYKKGKLIHKGFSFSRLTKEGWSEPEGLKIDNYTAFDKGKYNNACISHDEKIIIYSLCPVTNGVDNDLYISFKKEDGSYTEPLSLGDSINKKGFMDFAPFLAPDNQTLYFASDRPGGLGATDIYKTTRQDDSWKKWSTPVNMGPKTNGAGRDGYYTLDARGMNAYMVSDENSIGKADIVLIQLELKNRPNPVALLRGNVYDAKTNKMIEALVEYHEYPVATIKGETHTDHETGKYSVVLPYSEKFVISAHAHGYVASFDTLNYVNATEYTEQTKDFYLTPIIKGEKVVLKHVNFETNSAVLESSSFIELDKVAEFLIENPEVKILIGGHTDNAGLAEKNLTLSEARAKSVMEYVLSKGVTVDRLESKGFGQTQPIVANDTPENMRINRRVDFTITQE